MAEEKTSPTDLAPAVQKVIRRVVVKAELLGDGRHARIRSRDGEVDQIEPFIRLEKRWPKGACVVYFQAQISSTVGALEIADRLELAPEKRW